MMWVHSLVLIFCFLFLGSGFLYSNDIAQEANYKIIQTKNKLVVSWTEILKEMDGNDILIWGEEHDDVIGHLAQAEFFKKFTDTYPTALSLESLERDHQKIIEEYYRGYIPEKQLIATINHWKNFTTDYLPLVKHSKESYSPILCSNPPRRYVNAVARRGMVAYMDFSDEALSYLPHGYTLGLYQSEIYLSKLRGMFPDDPTGGKVMHPQTESMILAQYMWDQGMADSVSREIFRSGRKIFHINGRFHSDEEGGVAYRLRKMGHKVLVLSVFPEGKEEDQNFAKLADFVILTKRR